MTPEPEVQTKANSQLVRKIQQGTVIDHIPAGKAIQVLQILDLLRAREMVALLMNASSQGGARKKDVLKVAGRTLSPSELSAIALVAPNATINIIDDFQVVKKYNVDLPTEFRGIARCPNSRCVTNFEHVETHFRVFAREPLKVLCTFCERIVDADSLVIEIHRPD